MSGNMASGQGSVFNVANAELVSFDNVTFADNLGQLPPLYKMLRHIELLQNRDPAAPVTPGKQLQIGKNSVDFHHQEAQ